VNFAFAMNMKKKDCTLLGFDDRLFRLIGIPVVAMLIPLLFFREIIHDTESYWRTVVFGLVHTTATWQGIRAIFIYLSKKFPNWTDWKKRMKWIVTLSIIYTSTICIVVNTLLQFFLVERDLTQMPNPIAAYGASYLLVLAIGAVYESIRFFQLWQTTAVEKEHLERAHLASQLEGLRNQVNPHFCSTALIRSLT